ncbi:Ger(x)C family spore germination protein [Lysinibacillus antri]|uniref:Ger(X)C family spore germination protein n=1 Tax=Lysinibacillus antri TaxID=2498145 RepID=A0A3S0P2C5_9BACI|nr:Ger(x)C family spore germination protein [Lysinibacillus antri]RUL48625.1 Ger(x)C family spore germination protein [Lysinibacillus antri]
MKKTIISVIFLMMTLVLTACLEQYNLEKLGLATVIGYDLDKEEVRATAVLNQFQPEEKNAFQVVSSPGNTSKTSRQSSNLETSNKIVGGQLRVVVLGESLAEEGVLSITDTLSRDASIGTMLYLCVSKGNAKEILETKPPVSDMGTYLYNLLKQNIEGELLVSATLHEFLQAYYDPGKDPILPLVTMEDKSVKADGLVVFNNDKVVGFLKGDEGFYIKLIRERFKAGSTEISIPSESVKKFIKNKPKKENIFVVVDDIKSNSKITLVEASTPKYKITIHIDSVIKEVSEEVILEDPESLKTLEELIEKEMEKKVNNIMKKLQEMNSDPLGFGMVYDSSIRNKKLTHEEWKDMFPHAEFDVEINVDIVKTGIVE